MPNQIFNGKNLLEAMIEILPIQYRKPVMADSLLGDHSTSALLKSVPIYSGICNALFEFYGQQIILFYTHPV